LRQIAATLQHCNTATLQHYNTATLRHCNTLPCHVATFDITTTTTKQGTCDAYPPARDFAGYYMGAFKKTAQRGAPAALMCAYNALYGIPACASPVNNALVRAEWGWDGFVISDCGAVSMISSTHNYTHDPNATMAAAMNQGGVDVNCGSGTPPFYTK
jgi:beta-glucosidase-like glycosyl hydrolase